jgi:hypothetical protein
MIEIEKIRKRYCGYVNYWDGEMCGDLKPKKLKKLPNDD